MNDTQMLNWLEYHFERTLGTGVAHHVACDVHKGVPVREAIMREIQASLDLNAYNNMATFGEIASNELFTDGLGRLYQKTNGLRATQLMGSPHVDSVGDRTFYAAATVYVNPRLFRSKKDEQLILLEGESSY